MTGLTTVMPSPASNNKRREAFRFASIASHNLPCRERFAKRFSEGVFETPKTLFLYALTAFPVSAARNAEQGHTYRAIQGYSRNCLNISMWRGKRQPSGCGSVTKHAPGGETGGTVVGFGRGNTFFTTEAQRFGSKDAPVGPGALTRRAEQSAPRVLGEQKLAPPGPFDFA
jgi:hypothetical protein